MSPLSVVLVVGLALNVVLLLAIWLRLRPSGDDPARAVREEARAGREEQARAARDLREEVAGGLKKTAETTALSIGELGKAQTAQLEAVRGAVDLRLKALQDSNEKRLEQMQKTVDEKLQGMLEQRLSESFKRVGEQLEGVQRGLGEMRALAAGVGDLKRVLSNVRARGVWGEIQLGALLEQMLTAEQFDRNVRTKPDSAEQVEFAVRLPGPEDDPRSCVWLPIDAKFPQEDYLRLVQAAEVGDADQVNAATAALGRAIRAAAKDISEKYLNPPRTTDFALMFLPTEGLYAEVLRQPGLVEELQRTHRIVPAGPTTLTAILSSLRLGFRTLAIEKRSSEVWKLLATVKAEFGKFGDALDKVGRQLDQARDAIQDTGKRTQIMRRKLREVEELPAGSATELLGIAAESPGEAEDAGGSRDKG